MYHFYVFLLESKDKEKQQNILINCLLEYYIQHGITNANYNDSSNAGLINNNYNKTIIDLFCRLPDDLCAVS